MYKKSAVMLFVVLLAVIFTSEIGAADTIKLGILRFSSPHELLKEADIITNTFTQTLSASGALKLINRTRTDINTSDLQEVSSFGKSEGCKYILIGSVKRDRDIVISVRAVDVQTAKIIFVMSETVSKYDNASSLRPAAAKIAEKVREHLTGEYPKVASVKGKDISINRGSSSGIKKGDLFLVYKEFSDIIGKEGGREGKLNVKQAVIEVKSVQKTSSTTNLFKNGGDEKIISELNGRRIEPISKAEAQRLIRQKTFSMKTIESEVSDATSLIRKNSTANEKAEKKIIPESELDELKQKAEIGYPVSQYRLGRYYLERNNYPLAVRWYQEAASMGNVRAQVDLGYMYEKGFGVTQNYTKAFELYLAAAELGDPEGQNNLAWLYLCGYGTELDERKGLMWFEKSAAQGYSLAILHLGVMYEIGHGVAKNLDKAYELFGQYYDKENSIGGKLSLGKLYSERINEAATKKDKLRYLNKAREWSRKALEQAQQENNTNKITEARKQLDELSRIKIQ